MISAKPCISFYNYRRTKLFTENLIYWSDAPTDASQDQNFLTKRSPIQIHWTCVLSFFKIQIHFWDRMRRLYFWWTLHIMSFIYFHSTLLFCFRSTHEMLFAKWSSATAIYNFPEVYIFLCTVVKKNTLLNELFKVVQKIIYLYSVVTY